MRRPRHKLQVSTFPFLAVLLGAMGALILLLLVMDRRSKLVARARAVAAHEARLAERKNLQDKTSDEDKKQRQHWEQKRLEIHEMLVRQEQALESERQQAASRLTAVAASVAKEDAELAALRKSLADELARLEVKKQLLE